MNRKLARTRLEIPWPAGGQGEAEGGRRGDTAHMRDGDHDEGPPASFTDGIPDLFRKEQGGVDVAGHDGEYGEAGDLQAYSLPDAEAFLAGLVREGIINAGDRGLIYETVIKERPLKGLTADPVEYERLKKRRQRALTAMREHLRNSSK
jgi:hypothetical protein